jgi:hypothetical protein
MTRGRDPVLTCEASWAERDITDPVDFVLNHQCSRTSVARCSGAASREDRLVVTPSTATLVVIFFLLYLRFPSLRRRTVRVVNRSMRKTCAA